MDADADAGEADREGLVSVPRILCKGIDFKRGPRVYWFVLKHPVSLSDLIAFFEDGWPFAPQLLDIEVV